MNITEKLTNGKQECSQDYTKTGAHTREVGVSYHTHFSFVKTY